jgi:hypothetical protein
MKIGDNQYLEVIEAMENFIERKRPPVHIRDKMDLGYRIEDQNIFVFDIRPQWNKPEVILHHDLAKCTYVKAKNHWKIFWMRGNGNWHSYSIEPIMDRVHEFAKIVEEDAACCFFG